MKTHNIALTLLSLTLLIGCGNTSEGMKKDTEQNSENASSSADKMSEDANVAGSNIGAATMLTPKIKLAITGDTFLNDTKNLINVEATDAKVTLNGHVTSEKLKTRATDIAKRVMTDNGATQPFENLLTIKP